MRGLRRLCKAWLAKPTAVTLPLVMIFVGIAALVLGADASQAFTNLGGSTMIRVMGGAMLVGGLLVGTSIVRNDAVLEVVGLVLAAFGAFIYGIGCYLGLQAHGVVTGTENIGIVLAFIGRVYLLKRVADQQTYDP